MKTPKIAVVPYLCGDKLMVSVEINGKEVYEAQQDLSFLFKHFSEVINPNDQSHEDEAYALIAALEEGIQNINDVLGD